MRVLFYSIIGFGLILEAAEAVQICPAGNPRVAPDSRYTDNSNGTITDNTTGLMWKQCSEGQSGFACGGTVTTMTWSQALSAGANSSFAGFNDWRIPDVKELRSLIETGCVGPAINETRFPNTAIAFYLTSSSVAGIASRIWVLDSQGGALLDGSKNSVFAVRLVRGGQ